MLGSFAISDLGAAAAGARGIARQRALTHTLRSVYAGIAYGLTATAFLYVGAVALGVGVPHLRRFDPLAGAVIDVGLLALFALHHHYVQRAPGAWRWLPGASESLQCATDFLVAGALLFVVLYGWQPLPSPAWAIASPVVAFGLRAAYGVGWVLLADAARRRAGDTDRAQRRSHRGHLVAIGSGPPARAMRQAATGLTLITWCTPTMSCGHLLFSSVLTAYALCYLLIESRNCDAARSC